MIDHGDGTMTLWGLRADALEWEEFFGPIPAPADPQPETPARLIPIDTSIMPGHPCMVCGQAFQEFYWFSEPLDDWSNPNAPDVVVGLNGPSFKEEVRLGRWCNCGAVQTVEQPEDRDEMLLVWALRDVVGLKLYYSRPEYLPTNELPENVTLTIEQIAHRTIGPFGG